MDEGARWRRYFLPGAVLEGLLATWLFFDAQQCTCYGSTPAIDGAAFVGLAVVATIPLGFLAHLVADLVASHARSGGAVAAWLLKPRNDAAIAAEYGDTIRGLGVGFRPDDARDSYRAAVANELASRIIEGQTGKSPAGAGFTSLEGRGHERSDVIGAILLAVGIAVVSALVSSAIHIGDNELDVGRLGVFAGWIILVTAVLLLVRSAQRRALDGSEFYLGALLGSLPRDDRGWQRPRPPETNGEPEELPLS